MSCRVLQRGLEEFVLNDLARLAGAAGAERLTVLFRPSGRNSLVAEFLPRAGFRAAGEAEGAQRWTLEIGAGRAEAATPIRGSSPAP